MAAALAFAPAVKNTCHGTSQQATSALHEPGTGSVHSFTRISDIGQIAWDSCFPAEIENYAYLEAVEHSKIENFDLSYLAFIQDNRVLACVPSFRTRYNLVTTAGDSALKRCVERMQARKPGFMKLKLACLGSPVTEFIPLGFDPAVTAYQRSDILKRLLQVFQTDAVRDGYHLMAVKDVPEDATELWDRAEKANRFVRVSGQANASMIIDFGRVEDYVARFSAAARKDMRRKLKNRPGLRIRYATEIDEWADAIHRLYMHTLHRSEQRFEVLPKEYFLNVLRSCSGRAFMTLYYLDSDLIGANLLIENGDTLLDKFFVMDDVKGKAANLYFVSWFENVEYCLSRNIKTYRSGQSCDDLKVRLGSTLTPSFYYFSHANPIWHFCLRSIAPHI